MEITKDIKYVGVNDESIRLFEGQYEVENGMSYNSYVILDEKVAVLDTADANFTSEWMENVKKALAGRKPDYLVVHHMEPDHSMGIHIFLEEYKEAKVVSGAKSFAMMKQFFGTDFADRQISVGDGDVLDLGNHSLTFFTAPMVHWPEVIVSYEAKTKTLFSADAFGKFGKIGADEEWDDEARRYYIGIVGKYGAQANALLSKLAGAEVTRICPLHGPVLTENLGHYLDLYKIWAGYESEKKGVAIFYSSVYGNTKKAAELLAEELKAKGTDVVIHNLAVRDFSFCVSDAFCYDKVVLATTTYNAGIFPYMHTFINHLTERNFQNKTVAFIENGSWAPMATKVMKGMLEKSKNLTFCENEVSIKSALSDESIAKIKALAEELSKK